MLDTTRWITVDTAGRDAGRKFDDANTGFPLRLTDGVHWHQPVR